MKHFWLILLMLVSVRANAQQDNRNTGDDSANKDVFEWFIKNHPSLDRDASETGYGQQVKETEPVSPQAATMQRFGEYPMDYSTGVPHISIPLYDVKLGNYTLPISISYHASGIKVQDVSSPVGLGWSLMAGGYIIRQEKSGVDNGQFLFKSESEINNGPNSPTLWFDMVCSNTYNTESDRYAYYFNGKSGVFRYAILDGSDIRTIPYTPLKIVENGTGYKITDTDGIRYYFMAEEKNRGDFTYGGNRVTMTWYLTKIEFPDHNDSIVLKYQQDAYYYQQYISEYMHQGVVYSCNAGEDYDYWTSSSPNTSVGNSAIHSIECANMLLKEISWRGNKITFNYTNDRIDHVMMINNNKLPRLTGMTVKNYNGSIVRSVSFDNAHYMGGTALSNRMILEGLTISGSNASSNTENYAFDYNNISLPNYFNATFSYPSEKDRKCHEDYWGYYNGTNSTYWTPDSCMPSGMTGANRSANQAYAKAGILERITYPTGGYTDFTYESNRLDNGTPWGGLRLNNIKNYNSNGTLLNQRTYQYSSSRIPVTASLSTLYEYMCTYWYYYSEWINRWVHHSAEPVHTVSLSNPYLSLTGDYGSPIYYGTVTEYYGTTTNNEGKTVYNYYDDSRSSDYYSYEDEDASSLEPPHLYSMDYNVDNGNISPLLSIKEVYENTNGTYTLKHSESYSYEDVSRPAFNVGVRFQSRLVYIDLGGSNPYPTYNNLEDVYSYHDVIAVPSFVRLASKTVKDYQAKVTTTTTYSYDSSLRTLDPISEKVSSTSGDYYRTDYSYPFNMSGSPYGNMVSANMMIPVETRLYRNGTLAQTVRRSYTYQNGIFVNTSISTAKGTASLEQRMQYTYDSYGNLTSAIKGGLEKTAFIWSYNLMYPVAKVHGLTYEQAYTAANGVVNMSSFPNTFAPSTSTIYNIGSALNNAGGLATVYAYTPLVGITSTQSPRGEKTYFGYDNMGRLTNVSGNGGSTIETYTYNYGTQSYVRKRTMTDTSGSSYRETTDFYDGLGRKSETVAAGQSPNGSDLVVLTEYDGLNRPVREWLPTAISGSGNYISPASYASASRPYYGNDAKPYSLTEYEACPSDKPLKQYGPGSAWQNGGKAVEAYYTGNSANDVRIYIASNDDSSLTGSGTYAADQLFVVRKRNEDGNYSYTFTDKEGRLILERRMDGSEQYNTYYVYDIYGNLAFVLPPAASDALTSGTWSITTNTTLKNYAYNYKYDSRNRCIEKKLPGCEKVTITYDTADRVIATQDGVQRTSGISTYYEYDTFGRQTVMGTKTSTGVKTPLLINYYDTYSFLNNLGSSASNYTFNSSGGSDTNFSNATGMLTGTRVSQLTAPTTYYYTAFHYGERERLVQSHSGNHLGGLNHEYYTYNFTGTVAIKKLIHSASGMATQTEIYTNTYDVADRLTNVTYKLNSNTVISLVTNTYDAVGRLLTKTPMNSETITYAYNIRSWLTGITSTRFTQTLAYNANNGSLTPSTYQWGGNVAAFSWKAGSETNTRTYKNSYDALDRLTAATYSGTGNYTTQYSYDKMGNFQTLKRNGLQASGTYNQIDNLTFTYTGNQVTKVEDTGTVPTYNGAFNFVNGASQSNEYTYDQNGNMTKDLNKNISSIQYNLLNLPQSITYSTNKSATYTYDAEGNKLRVVYTNPSSTIDYCGNMIYEGGALKQILVDGGYVTFSGTTPQYHYYLKDHLGNNRVVCSASGSVEQVNHYYPYGGLFGESTNGDIQRFKYNGKELDRMHGLDWYDYGARHMTPDVGRFTTMDPLAEKYYHTSPYAYCADNPINAIDINGDSIYMDQQSIKAFLNGLKEKEHVSLKFNNGILDPSSISENAQNSDDIFLKDLYEIASDSRMVELRTSFDNVYKVNGKIIRKNWIEPSEVDDNDFANTALSFLKQTNQPIGRHVQGNLGQTLFPNGRNKQSTNGNIQIIINGKGNINAQSIGIAHEFAHVILYLRDLPSGHGQPGVNDFVYGRATMMSKRLGYDY